MEISSGLVIALITLLFGSGIITNIWSAISSKKQKKAMDKATDELEKSKKEFQQAQKDNAQTKLLLGIGHDKIDYLGRQFIHRGYVTFDEYENLFKYLYLPYIEMGGNGYIERLMEEIEKLPKLKEHPKE